MRAWHRLVPTLRKTFKFKGPVYAFDVVAAAGGGVGSAVEVESAEHSQPACRFVGPGNFMIGGLARDDEGTVQRLSHRGGGLSMVTTIVPRNTMFTVAPQLIKITDFTVRR